MSQLTEMIADTGRMVAIPSVSGEEHSIARYVFRQLQDIGLSPEMTDAKDGVFAHARGKNPNAVLMLNGHFDNVPYKRRQDLLLRKGNRGWYKGHGSGDMKAGVAVQLDFARQCSQEQPPCDILFSFVPREELDGSGSAEQAEIFKEHFLSHYPPEAIGGIILEPTHVGENGYYVGFGNRGRANLIATATGVTGHSGLDYRGQPSAIGRIMHLGAELPLIQTELAETYSGRFGIPTINATSLTAGSADNVVPAVATMGIDVRSTEELAKHWEEIAGDIEKKYGVELAYADASRVDIEACDPDSRIYRVAENEVTPERMGPFLLGASDIPSFTCVGVQSVLYGPGDSAFAHTDRDRVHPNALMSARKRVGRLIEAFVVFDAASVAKS